MGLLRGTLGLALGGGAARGLAHLGVLKALDEAGLRADYVCGTSAGSIVAALYAGGYSWEEIAEVTRALDWGDFIQPVFPKLGLVRAERLERRLEDLLGDRRIEDLGIPFRAVTVDLVSAGQYVIDSGPVARAVRASCSIPGIFEPVELDGRVLVDGGVLNDVPADVCLEMGADYVIAVDLNSDIVQNRKPENLFNVIMFSFAVMVRGNRMSPTRQNTRNVKLIAPNLSDFNYHNLKRIDELMQRGEDAMRSALPDLMRTLKRRRIVRRG
ncbi:MAG: patatin-like phospholipase family protein [Spirochaetota bacterium]